MVDGWDDLLEAWDLTLRAAGIGSKTRRDYPQTVGYFRAWLGEHRPGTGPGEVTRRHVAGWLAALAETGLSPVTIGNRYRHLQQWYKYLVEDEQVYEVSPMYGLRPPKVPKRRVPRIPPADIITLAKSLSGPTFNDRRDLALVLVLMDTGIRREECCMLDLDDVDVRTQRLRIIGKGDKERAPAFGATTALAINKYLRERSRRHGADGPALWLSRLGTRLTPEGLHQMLVRRAEAAGIPRVRAHRFRHTLADAWLRDGGSETDLMAHMGWDTRQMIGRYTADAAQDRAAEAHRAHGLADRLLRDPKRSRRR